MNSTGFKYLPLAIIIFLGLGSYNTLWAQPSLPTASIIFDANRQGYNPKTEKQIFEGDVVAIGAATLIAADKIIMDHKGRILEASGQVILMSQDQVFTGNTIRYNLDTGDFEITNAIMIANDTVAAKEITDKILGITLTENDFVQAKSQRLVEIGKKKKLLRDEARRQSKTSGKFSPDLVGEYAVLLEQEELVTVQQSPSLTRLSEERRTRFIRRREYWKNASQVGTKRPTNSSIKKAYFRMSGNKIARTNGNDFIAHDAIWTSCKCDEGESPAWGFSSDYAEAQLGGYADLYHPILKIKGIPVLYLPYLKLPVKDQRQSGFLMPVVSFEDRSGNIYSQPVYFDFSDSSDATFTTDVFEKRGTRLGVEYRIQQKEHTGWEFNVEGMRDRLWMADRGLRQDMRSLYKEGLTNAQESLATYGARNEAYPKGRGRGNTDSTSDRAYLQSILDSPEFWIENYSSQLGSTVPLTQIGETFDPQGIKDVKRLIDNDLAIPQNSWRSRYAWRGVTFLAPRLSFQSSGDIASDHRYAEELYLPNDFNEAIFDSKGAKTYSLASGIFHLDAQDFYAGLSTLRGDNFLLDYQFEGQQIPMRFKAQTKVLSVFPDQSPFQSYLQVKTDIIAISENPDEIVETAAEDITLGQGNWRQIKASALTPLNKKSVLNINHFAEAEVRYIDSSGISEDASEIRSWKTGFEFSLPVDGKGDLPEFLQDEEQGNEALASRKMIHHLMNWKIRFSTRPVVINKGPYLDENLEESNQLAYFASDMEQTGADGSTVNDEDRMTLHKRITLSTTHRWKLFERGWQFVSGAKNIDTKDLEIPEQKLTTRERARQELMYDLDTPISGDSPIVDPESDEILVNHYERQDKVYATPVELGASISYDFIDAEDRELQLERNELIDNEILQSKAQEAIYASERDSFIEQRDKATDESQIADNNAAAKERQSLAEAERAKQSNLAKEKRAAAEPWKGPKYSLKIGHKGYSLVNTGEYNIYKTSFKKLTFMLGLPAVQKTRISIGYEIDRAFDSFTNEFKESKTRIANLSSSLIPYVTTFISVKRQDIEDRVADYTNRYRISYGAKYLSSSDCWGLSFSRLKDYGKQEGSASYLLKLSVIFLGQPRDLPDMSPTPVREYKKRSEDS